MQDSKAAENGKTQDVLHYTPTPVKIVNTPEAIRLLEDPDYYIIIEILRKRPMTIREIEDAYRLRAADHESVGTKSYNTIYRYLKALEKAGLVIPAGKRIEFGKTASETLFSRTAKLFHYGCKPEMSKETLDFTNRIVGGLLLAYGESKGRETCVREAVMEITSKMTDEITLLAEKDDKGKIDKLMSGEWGNVIKALDFIAFFGVVLSHPELLEKLQDCF
jgi:DNA-binding transcriptional ArsR family regulator